MTKQPEALRIADELLALHGPTEIDERAVAELRRLHDQVERMRREGQRLHIVQLTLQARITALKQEAASLREQNTMLDAKLAALETALGMAAEALDELMYANTDKAQSLGMRALLAARQTLGDTHD